MDAPATGIRIIPPLLFLATFLVAWALHWLWPLSLGLPMSFRLTAGLVVTIASLAVAVYLYVSFLRAGTVFETMTVPKALVTTGLFRFSRNPGYVDLIVLGLGVAILFDTWWVVILLLPATIIVRQEAILKEEAMLESAFGEEYRRYKARVRRWL